MSYLASITIRDIALSLKAILNALVKAPWRDARGYVRTIFDTNSAISTVTTLTTCTSVSQLSGMPTDRCSSIPQMRASWSLNVRSRIS